MIIEKFDWEKGHPKRVGNCDVAIKDIYMSYTIDEIFACFNQNSEYLDKIDNINPKHVIEINSSYLSIYLYDMNVTDSAPVFNYDLID